MFVHFALQQHWLLRIFGFQDAVIYRLYLNIPTLYLVYGLTAHLEEAVHHLQRMRLEGKERYDERHGIRQEELAMGSIVLLHDTRHEKDMSQKLAFQWLGPYRIYHAVEEKRTYLLELDGSRLAGTFAGDRLKKFHPRQRLHLDHTPDLDQEVVPTLEDFLAADDDNLSDIPDDFSDL